MTSIWYILSGLSAIAALGYAFGEGDASIIHIIVAALLSVLFFHLARKNKKERIELPDVDNKKRFQFQAHYFLHTPLESLIRDGDILFANDASELPKLRQGQWLGEAMISANRPCDVVYLDESREKKKAQEYKKFLIAFRRIFEGDGSYEEKAGKAALLEKEYRDIADQYRKHSNSGSNLIDIALAHDLSGNIPSGQENQESVH